MGGFLEKKARRGGKRSWGGEAERECLKVWVKGNLN